jgi:hypothetical protein
MKGSIMKILKVLCITIIFQSTTWADDSYHHKIKQTITNYEKQYLPSSPLGKNDRCAVNYFEQLKHSSAKPSLNDLQNFEEALTRFISCNPLERTKIEINQIRTTLLDFVKESKVCQKATSGDFYRLTDRCETLEIDLKEALKKYEKNHKLIHHFTSNATCSNKKNISKGWLSCALLESAKDESKTTRFQKNVKKELQIRSTSIDKDLQKRLAELTSDQIDAKSNISCSSSELKDCVKHIKSIRDIYNPIKVQGENTKVEQLRDKLQQFLKDKNRDLITLLVNNMKSVLNEQKSKVTTNHDKCSLAKKKFITYVEQIQFPSALDLLQKMNQDEYYKIKVMQDKAKRKLFDNCIEVLLNPEYIKEQIIKDCIHYKGITTSKISDQIKKEIENYYKVNKQEALNEVKNQKKVQNDRNKTWEETAQRWAKELNEECKGRQ